MNKGYAIILTGYVGWGLFPLYWVLLKHVPVIEVLLHRMLWAVPVLLLLVLLSERRRIQVKAAFGAWRELKWLTLSSLVITTNWAIYIWAVANQQAVEASMGYFLSPLLNVLAGVMVFKEILSRSNIIAILFAAAGVAYYMVATATIPWIGLGVGFTFALYGLLRKQMTTNAVPGLFVETLLLLPVTLGMIVWMQSTNQAIFLNLNLDTDLLLIFGGPITVLPLLFFTAGTRMLPMTTVGILFYVTPTLQFLCGVLVLGEAFSLDKLIGFLGIWIGIAIFCYSLLASSFVNNTECVKGDIS